MGATNVSTNSAKQPSYVRRLKIYPRLQLPIRFNDLAASLCSFLYGSDREQNSREIQSFWNANKEVLVTLSVRTSLDLLLQSLKLPAGSEVLMSAVNIRDMVEVVKQHGLIPIPIDISLDTLAPSLESVESHISPKSRILIIAHLFGSIINLKPYAQFCKKHNLLLVEDCAQAFAGSTYYGDESADVSFFSFGPIKSCTALGGAVTLIRDRNLAQKMERIEQQYPSRSEFWFLKRVLKYFGLKFFSIPGIYGYLLALLKLLDRDLDVVINSMTRGFAQGDILSKIRYRPPSRMLALLSRRLSHCSDRTFERRESKARQFLSLLLPEISYPGKSADYHSFWVVPILVSDPDALMAMLRENGFDATRGNTSLTFIEDSRCCDRLSALRPMNAERLINTVLYLPISEDLPDTELTRLAQLVNEFYTNALNCEQLRLPVLPSN